MNNLKHLMCCVAMASMLMGCGASAVAVDVELASGTVAYDGSKKLDAAFEIGAEVNGITVAALIEGYALMLTKPVFCVTSAVLSLGSLTISVPHATTNPRCVGGD